MLDKEIIIDALKTSIAELNAELDMDANDKLFHRQTQALKDLEMNDYIEKSKYIQLAADFDNYKKRTERQSQASYDNGVEIATLAFLEAYDDLQRGIQKIRESKTTEDLVNDSVKPNEAEIGMSFILKKMTDCLTALGFEKIECSCGDKFDVNTMEAISTRGIQDDEGYDPDDVVEIYSYGWRKNGKIVRPAKVIVGKEPVEKKEME